ncbi:DUF4145 domain-containing protein [Pantoea agglomerans]|uniref:DUF4145 domain-containing protein n=1 Tax=Enterobacter agglomerans TaxID=549 RepID=UPI0032090151
MAFLVADCPRCGTKKIQFTIIGACKISERRDSINGIHDGHLYELQCACHECRRSTLFRAKQPLNKNTFANTDWRMALFPIKDHATILGPVTPADIAIGSPPEFLPPHIEAAYNEGSKCLAIGCFNASATMYRLCLDFATKDMLPADGEGPNSRIRRSLGLRIEWLLDNERLPEALRDLAECVKDDGNDGAHEGILDESAALDLREFSYLLLERIFTEVARIAEAKRRREERHK